MKKIIVIPARLASTRLPQKPLADICGKSMIQRVYEAASRADCDQVYVACSEIEVKNEVEKIGGRAIMTDPNLPSGTDRIAAALAEIDKNRECEIIVNMQGDVPNISAKIINDSIKLLEDYPDCDIATAMVKIQDKEQAKNPNVVKPVCSFLEDKTAKALYFSRSAVPYNTENYFEHIGLYVYRRESLEKFVSLPTSKLEETEKLEQLRALEAGMNIYLREIDAKEKPMNIDTIEDLEKIRNIISCL